MKTWMRGNHYRGVFPGTTGDRALPSPSPTANLAGIWKGNGKDTYRYIAAGFLFGLLALTGGECSRISFLSEG
jgi:hypothetical protein